MTKKNTASKFASSVAPTLTASKPAPTAVVAPATIGNMTQADLVALIAQTVAATLAASATPAKKPAAAKKPAVVPATKPAPTAKPADGQSKSAAYIARCNVDPKVVKGHLANAYRAGQAAQAGDRTAIGSGRYKNAYNATLISAGLPAFYAA
jgi:hypothetical protein